MAQTLALLQTLKRCLKAQGKTYRDVASALDLTEASVKRLFAEQSFSLQRLEQVCQMLDMELSDLFRQMEAQQAQLQQLTLEQEKEITDDLVLLLITVCVLNHWTLADIVDFYTIPVHDCIQKLAWLDRNKIIDLLPKNKIKLKVAANFAWRENGPIQGFFQAKIANEYFNSQFNAENEKLIVLNGMLSKTSNLEMQRKLKRLAREFEELNQEDANLDFNERHGTTAILAVRGWNYGLFKPLIK
ncbi:transcriptional regulator [Saccharobesus litoralis]|uniref:Transcriptional regulator n=1 Tax=Saccharobesus litoralis TaxID=2172099 RepID=A0A2S0VX22_9ALTE|nr:helix-turn-helix transcriptional regulator [Saccharobesus litoralis]AWB68787.1 transcriptional regulator [Saccharobesus litoralis]